MYHTLSHSASHNPPPPLENFTAHPTSIGSLDYLLVHWLTHWLSLDDLAVPNPCCWQSARLHSLAEAHEHSGFDRVCPSRQPSTSRAPHSSPIHQSIHRLILAPARKHCPRRTQSGLHQTLPHRASHNPPPLKPSQTIQPSSAHWNALWLFGTPVAHWLTHWLTRWLIGVLARWLIGFIHWPTH